MHEDELHRQIAELVADHTDRATPPPIAAIRRRGHVRRARLTSGAMLLIAALAAGLVAVQGPLRRQLAPVPVVTQPPRPTPDPRPHQWVYTKGLMVEHWNRKNGKPFTDSWERWVRVDGKKEVQPTSDLRAARTKKVHRSRAQFPTLRWCLAGKPERIPPPAVGLGRFFPNPAAVPTDPDGLLAAIYQRVENPDPACPPGSVGDNVQDRAFKLINAMLQTVQPAEIRAALYQALPKIPGVTVVQGATDVAGRRGVAFARAASIEAPGSSDRFRLEVILDPNTYRYLGARYVVTRDHFSDGTRYRKGQVFISWAELALAVVDAPCQRPGETTTCASYGEVTWVAG
jgi:hypothetical protein